MARIFKIGLTEIPENETTIALTNEEAMAKLSKMYPEAKNATIKETPRGEDTLVEALPVAGKKG